MTLQDGLDLHFLNHQCVVDMGHQSYFFSKLKSTDYVWFGLFVFPSDVQGLSLSSVYSVCPATGVQLD